MVTKTCQFRARVVATPMIHEFQGEAILAGNKPRFVVMLFLLDTKESYGIEDTGVHFTTHRAALFAIDSLVRLFGESDVVGKEYDLVLEMDEENGDRDYWLNLA
jgi:hypothetical protein